MPFLIAAVLTTVLLAHSVQESTASPGKVFAFSRALIGQELEASASFGDDVFIPLSFPVGPKLAVQVNLPILMYHHVMNPSAADSELTRGLTVDPASFEAQLSYLQQQGYQSVSMRQLFGALYYGEPLPNKPVLLTFDDGYADNYFQAAPVLEKYGFTGIFYIITGLVGSEGYMSWEQVLELEQKGMEIGAHTATHPDLTMLDGEALLEEVFGAGAVLGEKLGHPVYWFCYPSGKNNQGVIENVWVAGYLLEVTTDPGRIHNSSDPFRLPRLRVGPGTTMEQFVRLVE